MVEHNLAKDLINHDVHNYSTDVMTGDRNKRMYLYNQLALSIEKAETVDKPTDGGEQLLIPGFE